MTQPTGQAKISVIIPAYNAQATLPRAIESVLAQTLPASQVIVVDDGSSDGTGEVARKYPQPVEYVRQANAGASAARNTGICKARGELVTFLDADDVCLPDKHRLLCQALEACPTAGFAAGAAVHVHSGQERRVPPVGWMEVDSPGIVADFFEKYSQEFFLHTDTTMIRRSALEEVGPFRQDLRMGEDIELWSRLGGACDCVFVDQEVALYYQDTPGSLTNTARLTSDYLFDEPTMQRVVRQPLWESYRKFRSICALRTAKGMLLRGDSRAAARTLSLVGAQARDGRYWLVRCLAMLPGGLAGRVAGIGRRL